VNCVKFGMLSDAKDLTDLLNMVSEKGKEIENSQQVIVYRRFALQNDLLSVSRLTG